MARLTSPKQPWLRRLNPSVVLVGTVLMVLTGSLAADVCNIKVVSDSRPDFSDMESFLHSVTSPYETTDAQCKAIWRWLNRCRRQRPHPIVHGTPVHDPIMFFNDFGYSFCSDYAGINCGIWHSMGLPVRFWDIASHTVSECFYDGRWHMFDNSMSAYYTLCDGKTVAGVEDIGKSGACQASHGETEKAHIALVHCVGATSPYGFLTGADTQRSLRYEGAHCFNPNALKYRYYYNGFELGHRYVLNLRANETYTRYAAPLGEASDYYLPLENGKSPQGLETSGNGLWVFAPDLTKESTLDDLYGSTNVAPSEAGLTLADASRPGEVIFRVNGANIVTSSNARLGLDLPGEEDICSLAVSTDHGHSWTDVWQSEAAGEQTAEVSLDGVAGSHQFLVRFTLTGRVVLKHVELRTVTQLNKLTLPILGLGRNTIDVVVGRPTETILFWPELQRNAFKESCFSSANVESGEASDWHGCLWLSEPGTGTLVYELAAPGDMTELTYGGRFYNRAPKSSITLEHSTDEGKTWTEQWKLTDTEPPWDVVHFETVKLPAGTRRALVRYTLTSAAAGAYSGCSVYSVRTTVNYRPPEAVFEPLEVTYNWSELHQSEWTERSHSQPITEPRQRYFISVGGDDLPRTNWVRVNLNGAVSDVAYGYSDGVDLDAEPFVHKRHIWGNNLALGKTYTFSVPSGDNWEGGDPEMTKLTDESVASTYGGGTTYREGPIWTPGRNPVITLDLKEAQELAAVRMHITGYPYDLYAGPSCNVEVLTSLDGEAFVSQGTMTTRMRHKDVDGNFVMPEHGSFQSWVFPLIFEEPAEARYVRYAVTNPEMFFNTSEIMAYDSVRVVDWQEPLAMPLDSPR